MLDKVSTEQISFSMLAILLIARANVSSVKFTLHSNSVAGKFFNLTLKVGEQWFCAKAKKIKIKNEK